jgi:hypothetical protein
VSSELREEVSTLQARVATMSTTIDQLTGLVDMLLLERRMGTLNPAIPMGVCTASEALGKKRKLGAASAMGPPAVLDLTAPFDDLPANFELERDEAALFSKLSIDGDADSVRGLLGVNMFREV